MNMTFTRGMLIALIVLALAALSVPFMMGGMMSPAGMGWGPAAAGGWRWSMAWGLGGLMMLVVWGAVVAGIVLLVRAAGDTRPRDGPRPETALDILGRRYAAGDLTREQYEQMRHDLE